MGQGSKKKKKSGKRSKGRSASKDKASLSDVDNELLTEEITALCAIFQEDCKVIPESPPKIIIKLRPYSKDMGFEDVDVSALLSVRFLPGYPHKCPKLQLTPDKGLSMEDVDKLLSLLNDQANSNAREGRVMIFNLVEAAQEFLSEVVPLVQVGKLAPLSTVNDSSVVPPKELSISSQKGASRGPFVFGFIDLFSASGESWNWGPGMKQNIEKFSFQQLNAKDGTESSSSMKIKDAKSFGMPDKKQGQMPSPIANLDTLHEESEDDDKSKNGSVSSGDTVEEPMGDDYMSEEEDIFSVDHVEDDESDTDDGSHPSKPFSSDFKHHHQTSQNVDKDLILVHLLHLACGSKGPLADALPQISSELYNLGLLSEEAQHLALRPSALFRKTFDHAFQQHITSSRISHFWKPIADQDHSNTSLLSSRYLNDFEELQSLGHGGFGHVVLCKNKLDGRQYAIKKIRLKDKSLPLNDRILREVATLSRLQHQHVVRYYQAWFETGIAGSYGDAGLDSMTAASSTFSDGNMSSTGGFGRDSKLDSTYLYIQMEYCPRTLRQDFESYHFDKELAWHLFRQIVEGLAHIHGQGIIHRDLTPSNIFFDARNDIKIGDFGLAKFLKLEQLDQDPGLSTEATGVSMDGTGQIGTYFYTAPEIEQGWPKIDEKADMYSLGVVFFELWHPFGTAMERHIMLSDLKLKGNLPSTWVSEFPEQASLLQRLMSSSPSDRPSAMELLQHAFPPRMEYELLDNMLRTMRTSEDTRVYDKVVSAIFDEEALMMKDQQQHTARSKLDGNADPYNSCTEFGAELRDHIVDVTTAVFRQHCGKHLEFDSMHMLYDQPYLIRNTVKVLSHGGDMLELCHELRLPFVNWVVKNEKSTFNRYEVSYVYRRAIGHSPPNRLLQGDFDIIGGVAPLTEAEIIKVTMDIVTWFFPADSCTIHLNHGDLLDSIWCWIGIKAEHRQKVAELLSLMSSLRPQSPEWKSKWVVIRRQLLQELKLAEAVVNRLQTVGFRFCGAADQALPRLRGALPTDKFACKALDELSDLFSYLRVWKIGGNIYINALMPPSEGYYRDIFYQVYLSRENTSSSLSEDALLAVGGRYDYLLHQLWERENKTNPPGAVGTSLALETMIEHSSTEIKPFRNEACTSVLVCSRGGGGLLEERMELAAELWKENIKAEIVPAPDPSLTEQYEYANEHNIKCLVILTDANISQSGSVKVRHLELKREKVVNSDELIKFLLEATGTQFRNLSLWI
ncbi:hypothetical protein SAY87_021247 [Trapa incisa]|uniref:non-specific serine/threonine protein kinase n=1 Tax=Trapa incisa TaxID=236973 RepID=A0AAN7PQZ4_9MYRT|nr:hypothetical protein SAY87_021247 [Trapa incisa]